MRVVQNIPPEVASYTEQAKWHQAAHEAGQAAYEKSSIGEADEKYHAAYFDSIYESQQKALAAHKEKTHG